MDLSLQIAIITATSSLLIGVLTFLLGTIQKKNDDLQSRKLQIYSELMESMSDLSIYGPTEKATIRFAKAINTIVLTAPENVVKALIDYQNYIAISNKNRTVEEHDLLLKKLVLEIRKSLKLPYKDNYETFSFHMVGAVMDNPNNQKRNCE